jgi:hypothetical protein
MDDNYRRNIESRMSAALAEPAALPAPHHEIDDLKKILRDALAVLEEDASRLVRWDRLEPHAVVRSRQRVLEAIDKAL